MTAPAQCGRPPHVFRDSAGWYLGLSAYWFATSFKWFILLIMLPLQVAEVVPGGEKNTWWGRIVSIGAVEAMIGPAICGLLSDRFRSRFGRRRPFIAVGAGATAFAMFYLGSAESLWAMALGYLLLQISDDIGTGPYSAMVPDLVPEERRGHASGIMGLLQLLAQIVAAGTALVLRDFFAIYMAIAAVNVICAVIVIATVKEESTARPADAVRPPSVPLSVRLRRGLDAWLAPWASSDFRWVWFTRFLNAFGYYLILLYLTNYLKDRVRVFDLFGLRFGEVFQAMIILALVISLMGALSAVRAGRLADRIGRKAVVVWSGWVMFLTLVPFALIPVYWVVMLLAIPFGVGYGAYVSASWALVSDVLPSREDSGKDMGIWQSSVTTPQLLTGLAGWIVDMGNRVQMGFGYQFAFLVASVAFLLGCILVRRIRGST